MGVTGYDTPDWAYSIGMWHTHGGFDICITGLPVENAMALVAKIARQVRDGRALGAEKRRAGRHRGLRGRHAAGAPELVPRHVRSRAGLLPDAAMADTAGSVAGPAGAVPLGGRGRSGAAGSAAFLVAGPERAPGEYLGVFFAELVGGLEGWRPSRLLLALVLTIGLRAIELRAQGCDTQRRLAGSLHGPPPHHLGPRRHHHPGRGRGRERGQLVTPRRRRSRRRHPPSRRPGDSLSLPRTPRLALRPRTTHRRGRRHHRRPTPRSLGHPHRRPGLLR